MITKEAAQQAYDLGVAQALLDAGFIKEAGALGQFLRSGWEAVQSGVRPGAMRRFESFIKNAPNRFGPFGDVAKPTQSVITKAPAARSAIDKPAGSLITREPASQLIPNPERAQKIHPNLAVQRLRVNLAKSQMGTIPRGWKAPIPGPIPGQGIR